MREKAQRLEPVVEQVMARKPAEDHPPLPSPDYAFPAIPRAIADRCGSDDFHKLLDQDRGGQRRRRRFRGSGVAQ